MLSNVIGDFALGAWGSWMRMWSKPALAAQKGVLSRVVLPLSSAYMYLRHHRSAVSIRRINFSLSALGGKDVHYSMDFGSCIALCRNINMHVELILQRDLRQIIIRYLEVVYHMKFKYVPQISMRINYFMHATPKILYGKKDIGSPQTMNRV